MAEDAWAHASTASVASKPSRTGGPYRRLDVLDQLRVHRVPPAERGRRLERVVLRAGGQADVHGLLAAEGAIVEKQLQRALGADGVDQEPRAASARVPTGLGEGCGEPRVSCGDAQVTAQGEVLAGSNVRPLDRGDGGDPQRLDHQERVVHATEVVPDFGHGPVVEFRTFWPFVEPLRLLG